MIYSLVYVLVNCEGFLVEFLKVCDVKIYDRKKFGEVQVLIQIFEKGIGIIDVEFIVKDLFYIVIEVK